MPARLAPFLFGFLLSGLMSLVVSGVATLRNAGLSEGFGSLWAGAWLPSWTVAFPVVLVVAPLARRLVALAVRSEGRAQ
ncbi:DUF2798 domain-containing protein [Neotabrizicola shimadae]|uniref:DUF2798 domain-containing protein n=1 Tax=Neotabrizicola shimadae TaxID=2807096 RepID=A0A8G0ZWN1_9RHOB|nr:DUF2798 domain-containing protein [Neotabrizicola shimadae]QYZ70073.1 DUF2798 domain-containing protein [Neotabrizicola shimadae]